LLSRGIADSETASEIAQMLERAVARARDLARGLQPVAAEGLSAALQDLASQTERMFGIACAFLGDPSIQVHDNVTATHLYRIAQEAARNAVVHGLARQIDIHLARSDGELLLRILDDGVGIGPGAADSGGLGLHIMSHRARLAGGELRIERREPRGTDLRCVIRDEIRRREFQYDPEFDEATA
jgi:signal transduction histidine kinase